jgi:hypothetical protein
VSQAGDSRNEAARSDEQYLHEKPGDAIQQSIQAHAPLLVHPARVPHHLTLPTAAGPSGRESSRQVLSWKQKTVRLEDIKHRQMPEQTGIPGGDSASGLPPTQR